MSEHSNWKLELALTLVLQFGSWSIGKPPFMVSYDYTIISISRTIYTIFATSHDILRHNVPPS